MGNGNIGEEDHVVHYFGLILLVQFISWAHMIYFMMKMNLVIKSKIQSTMLYGWRSGAMHPDPNPSYTYTDCGTRIPYNWQFVVLFLLPTSR